MRTVRTILYTVAALYMVYWVLRIQAEKLPHLLLPTILVLIIVFGYVLYKYVWPNLRRTRTPPPPQSSKPSRKSKRSSKS
jgi:hypothetical protein